MQNFFNELSKWATVDGDESVDATMNAGTELMMSFVGQQDKAEQVTDVLSKVMNYIKPFQKYVSPFGAIKTATDAIGGTIPSVGNLVDKFENVKDKGIELVTETFMDIVAEVCELGGMTDLPSDVDIDLPSIDGIENFLDEAGINGDTINSILKGAEDSLAKHSGTLISMIDLSVTVIGVMLAMKSAIGGGIGASSFGAMIIGSIGAVVEGVMLFSSLSKHASFSLGSFGLGLAISAGIIEVLAIAEGESTTTSKLVVVSDIGVGAGSIYYLTQKYD